jgi:hypothetical protein
MAREVWGTYSVKDHLAPRAFLADLMFYDRLVLPVPLPGEEDKWKDWNPKRQGAFISVLEEAKRVKTVPWKVDTWDRAKAAGEAGKDAFLYTRTRLVADIPKSVRGVTVVPTYSYLDELVEDSGLKQVEQAPLGTGDAIAALQFEFLAPEIDGPVGPDHLNSILEYTSTREHERARAAFWHWQRDFFSNDVITDQETIDAAVTEIQDLIADLRKASHWKGIKTRSQYLFLAGSVLLGILAGPLTPVAVGGVVLSVGSFALDKAADAATKDAVPLAALFAPDERSLPFKNRERR